MKVVSREQLKNKLDRGENIKLVMTMNQWAYDSMHIPGSLHFNSVNEAAAQLRPDDEIVLYCSTKWCHESIQAYLTLRNRGFNNLWRYAGGLEEWLAAHYPLEGDMVQPTHRHSH
jgi:rhodanese-related sulfurtransferase